MVFPFCFISDGCSSLCRVLLAGALQYSIARHVHWIPSYPCDKMKTLWQTYGGSMSLTSFARAKIQQEGWAFLFRGFGATLVRAVPQCGVTMAVYDFVSARVRAR